MGSRGRTSRRGRGDGWEVYGGYMNAKRQKLKDQFEQETPGQLKRSGSTSSIFKGVTIHVNGYTKPSSDELKRLMMLHGGAYEHYLYRTRITHVIATNLPDSKVREIRGMKVVRPEWITDSIEAGKLLSYTNYQLYTAQTGRQKGLTNFTVQHNQSADSAGSLQSKDSLNSVDSCGSLSLNKHGSSSSFLEDAGGSSEDESGNVEEAEKESSVDNVDEKENNAVLDRRKLMSPSKQGSVQYTSRAGDPKFLNEYYSNSRLHYLSTWKAECKSYINELQSKGSDYPGRERLRRLVQDRGRSEDGACWGSGKVKKCVMHIDMDCFFVSVGLRKRPDLIGKPVVVTHSRGKGLSDEAEYSQIRKQEQIALANKRSGKKGSSPLKKMMPGVVDDLGFPDLSDSDSGEEEPANKAATMATKETFHSRAEIASCSYEARKAGVRNGMFMGEAKRVCPDLITIPYDFEGYKSVSQIFYNTVASYTHDIEAVSCDEMLVDCTDILADTGATPLEFASQLRQEIHHKTGCSASAGLASNILLAKMATRKAKPNGQFHLTPDLVDTYIRPLSVKEIPGVGWSLTKKFEVMNVRTCGDLQSVTLETLQKEFGPKSGQSLYKYCRGQDERPIKTEQQRKSVSAEVNYGIRFKMEREANDFLLELAGEVSNRLKNINMKGKTLTLKLMVRRKDAPTETSKFMGHGVCDNFSKSLTLPMATDDDKILGKECVGLMRQMRAPAEDLRGVGIQVTRLESATIGNQGNQSLSKNQSILNFTVSKDKKDQTIARIPSITKQSTISTLNRRESVTAPSLGGHGLEIRSSGSTKSYPVVTSPADVSVAISNEAASESAEIAGAADDWEMVREPVDVVESYKHDLQSEGSYDTNKDVNLLEDLAKRQTNTEILPPLPCLPTIRTPDSAKKPCRGSVHTPGETIQNNPGDDYFPSPSQVDPNVLNELPPDIREQVEKEMQSRRKKKKDSKQQPTGPGCSHWQPEREVVTSNITPDHSKDAIVPLPSLSQVDPNVLNELPLDIREQVEKEMKSRQKKKEDSRQQPTGPGCSNWQSERDVVTSDITPDYSKDAIVPLPSLSQIDMSCLSALPDSMQDEIRQAYARQEQGPGQSDTTVSVGTSNRMLNLQQARSPSKSPSKRSPSKRSPQFKIPRGRPSKRGRKKGISKKLLFKNPQRSGVNERPEGTEAIPDVCINVEDDPNLPEAAIESNPFNPCSSNIPHASSSSSDIKPMGSNREKEITAGVVDTEVGLCGAVGLTEVKILLKEWIYSSPEPQCEDEDVLVAYLHSLVRDQNLERVDLILKYMYRNIHQSDNLNWLEALKRIFRETQAVVCDIYSGTLRSIDL